MSKLNYYQLLASEIGRLDLASMSKRLEHVISGYLRSPSPKAQINGRTFTVFNSNDYLGLRLHPALLAAEHSASQTYGVGPGAVRFISGTLQIHQDLETRLAKFHSRQAAMIFSSAFAANLAVISSLIKGQSKDSLVSPNTLVVSDELNHRSIIEGIRLANLPPEQRQVYRHLDYAHLEQILSQNVNKFARVLILSDGVFSMLGEIVDLSRLRSLADQYDSAFSEGVILYIDDCHGIGVMGSSGRGVEQVSLAQADVLIGTLGKAFGSDGGYVVGDQILIDYLRESCATYIYSNPISPGTAAAGLSAVELVDSPAGSTLLDQLHQNISFFKSKAASLPFAANSLHPIQPLLVGDPKLSRQKAEKLYQAGYLVTTINYPVVAQGRDEIRLQLSATHTSSEIAEIIKLLE